MKPEIIVAIDVPTSRELEQTVRRLPHSLRWFKVGLELFCAEGPPALATLHEQEKHIFLDLKLHDIPRTVARAIKAASAHRVDLITIHAGGGADMMEAAAEAAAACGPDRPKLLAVTVLTSLDDADLASVGVTRRVSDQVMALADLAMAAGIDGLVCSPQEVGELRKRLGSTPLLVTPGIRLPGDTVGDQKRVASPGAATRDGASHLVVGRPILDAADPGAALDLIQADILQAAQRE